MKILRKIGQIILTFLPFMVTMGLQVIMTIPVTFYYFLIVMSTQNIPGDINAMLDWMMTEMLYGDYGVIVTICWGIASLITFIFWYRKQRNKKDIVPLKQSVNIYSIGGLSLMVAGLQISIQYLYTYIEILYPEWFVEYNELMNLGHYSMPAVIAMYIYSVIIAPIHEEFLIRGVTQNFAKKAFPFWLANIVQAAIFGVLHMNIIQGSYAFLVGLFIGYVMHKAKNIWIPILFHFFFNLFGTIVPLKLLGENADSAYVLVIAIGIAILSAGIVLFEFTINNRDIALGIKES